MEIILSVSEKISNIQKLLELNGMLNCHNGFDSLFSEITEQDVIRELSAKFAPFSLNRLQVLLSPAAGVVLEELAQAARDITLQRFGRTMLLYAPLYLSSYCSNSCVYCGFNMSHKISRKRLTLSEAVKEAEAVAELGFKDILLVSGEDKGYISVNYLKELAGELKNIFSSISIEIYPLELSGYSELLKSGIDGVTLYQETYDKGLYAKFHTCGPKASFENRLTCQESAAEAGMRRLGIGSLLGLSNWRFECMAMALHADYLMKNYWKSKISFSFPRLKVSSTNEKDLKKVSDRDMTQMITALRICFPDAGLTLSTREPSTLRNNLINLGITQMSAESKTVPGGYAQDSESEAQFDISDQRSAVDIAADLNKKGFEPVWKDWDNSFNAVAFPER